MNLAALTAVLVVSLSGPTHTPTIGAHWPYVVRATVAGKPVRATVTTQLIDPFGGVHAVEFDCCKRNVVAHPFAGVFREHIEFPPESRGLRLTLRVIVKFSTLPLTTSDSLRPSTQLRTSLPSITRSWMDPLALVP